MAVYETTRRRPVRSISDREYVLCPKELRRNRHVLTPHEGAPDAPGFIAAQLVGAAAATALFRWLAPALPKNARAAAASPAESREREKVIQK